MEILKQRGFPEGKLEPIRRELTHGLLAMRNADGLFMGQGKESYLSSEAYVNPLGALALIPLLQECEGKEKTPGLGILATSGFNELRKSDEGSEKVLKNH